MAGPRRDLSALSFLVVDDKVFMRELVRAMLIGFGVENIITKSDGLNIGRSIDQNNIDVIILDWMMHPFSGLQVLKNIRRVDFAEATIPVIVLTGHADVQCVNEAMGAGADTVLSKPVSTKLMFLTINTLITATREFIQIGNYLGPITRAHREMMNADDLELVDEIDE
ncbi:MAG: hypothetical protein COB90_10165 [Hyphomicrobiales bacterium]|nr:MAG: hypothetical protein COB90_10165 [Hyphomicrobiales bacterium]